MKAIRWEFSLVRAELKRRPFTHIGDLLDVGLRSPELACSTGILDKCVFVDDYRIFNFHKLNRNAGKVRSRMRNALCAIARRATAAGAA